MSNPIHACEYVKALTSEEVCNTLAEKAMQLIYSVLPCRCDPPCRELTPDEKTFLQDKINGIIAKKRKERCNANLTLEDMCRHIARYMKEKTNIGLLPEQVYIHYTTKYKADLSYFLGLYEEAILELNKDYFKTPALEYFEDRLTITMDNPELKQLAIHYQNIVAALEKKFKSGGSDESDDGKSSS